VIEVSVPSHNNSTLKIKIEPDRSFDYLLDRVFKMCDIVESPNDYALVEYSTLKVNQPATLIRDIKQRHFELLRNKPKSYYDISEYPQHPPHHLPVRMETRSSFVSSSVMELNMRLDCRNASHIRSSFSVDVKRSVWQGKMQLLIENGELV